MSRKTSHADKFGITQKPENYLVEVVKIHRITPNILLFHFFSMTQTFLATVTSFLQPDLNYESPSGNINISVKGFAPPPLHSTRTSLCSSPTVRAHVAGAVRLWKADVYLR